MASEYVGGAGAGARAGGLSEGGAVSEQTAADAALQVLESSLSAERLAMIDAIVTGNNPMERWERHTGVSTFAHLMEWAERQLRDVMMTRAYRDIKNGGGPTDDDLGDYLAGKSSALSMMLANMRQIVERANG